MERREWGSALRGLLTMVKAMDGQMENRIRIQKSAYLLAIAGVADFRTAAFKYHHYGPYSRALSDTLQDSVVSGLLREKRQEYGDDQSKYTYELTDAGAVWLGENTVGADERIQRFAPWFKDAHWRALELAATTLFVERDECIHDRAASLNRAIELKPACASYRTEADSLLKRIGL